jgi:hypothetical protein
MLLLDFYFFQALRTITQSASGRSRAIIHSGYWALSVTAIVLLIALPYLRFDKQAWLSRSSLFAMIAGLFFAKVVASLFFLVDDLRRGIQWGAGKIFFANTEGESLQAGEKISRSLFLSWAGMIAGSGLFGSLIYGFANKYRYQVHRFRLSFSHLPASFRGLKIVHISDIHSGSFTNKEAVLKGVEKIINEQPDLILFTGDLVNNVASEMNEYIEVFSRLNAPFGVYSILGNHDYGDYVNWDTASDKIANLENLKSVHTQLGWRLLMNEHVVLEKGTDKIAVIGIENWSAKARFPKYGDLAKACSGAEEIPFKILLSHDPSHWKAEVVKHYPDIDLMLAGHTHGMQFGVEIPGLKWSPVQYVYKEWAGLYEMATRGGRSPQRLYVNRGFGFLGYPGRVGILPEITLLELSG